MSESTLRATGVNDMRKISNSEVGTWNTCQRKYYYEFDLAVEPRISKGALALGTLLHEVLAAYYTVLMRIDNNDGIAATDIEVQQSKRHDVAVNIARKHLMKYMGSAGLYELDTVIQVDKILQGYWNFYQGDRDWEILAVEQSYDMPITDEFELPMRLDLLIRERSTGKVKMVDHKTAYNFWDQDKFNLSPQFAKYTAVLRANNMVIDGTIVNQIRTRVIKNPTQDQLFRRTPYKPSNEKMRQVLKEHIIASQQIVRHRNLPLEVRGEQALRVLNPMVCQNCNVKELCMSEYDGGDIRVMLETDFIPRSYGYNNETEELL